MQGLLEARQELRPLLLKPRDRLRDLLFLDIALDSAVRTAVERGYEELNTAGPEVLLLYELARELKTVKVFIVLHLIIFSCSPNILLII